MERTRFFVGGVGIALVLVMVGVLVTASVVDLGRADQLASVVGGVIGLVMAGFSMARWRDKTLYSTPAQIDEAAGALRKAVGQQWREEAARRGLRPAPLGRVEWTVAAAGGQSARRPGQTLGQAAASAWRDSEGSWLFVVGPAGSGKSTFAIQLVLELLDAAETGAPVPVLLSVASWNPKVPFELWAVRKIRDNYRFLDQRDVYGGRAVAELVGSTRLLIILDGLDELSPGRRRSALEALGRSVPRDRPLVVTSREEPELPEPDLGEMLPDPGVAVLRLQGMDPEAALRYLSAPDRRTAPAPRAGWLRSVLRPRPPATPTTGTDARWQELRGALNDEDSPVHEVLTVPLYAALARRMYSGGSHSPAELADPRFANAAQLREHLVKGFVGVALRASRSPRHRAGEPAPAWGTRRAQRGLRDLASFMRAEGSQSLEWWRLERMVGPRTWLVTAFLAAANLYGLTADLPSGLRRGTALGFTVAVLINLSRGHLTGRRLGTRVGLAAGVGVALVGWAQVGVGQGLLDGVELGVGTGMCIAYAEHVRQGVAKALAVTGRAALMLGLLMGVVDAARLGPSAGVIRLITTGVGVFISVGMPLALTARFKVCGPPDQPGRLNLDLARSKPLLVQLSVGTLCGLGVGFGGALIGGLRYAVAHGVDQGILYGEHVGLTFSLSVGLGIGLVGGLVHWLTQPSTRRTAADPRSTLGAARTVALCYLLVPSATCAITLQLLAWVRIAPAPSTATPILTGAGLGFCLGLVFAAAFTAWPTYVLARLTAFFSGAPYGLMRLCAAAHTCEILRQDGAAYQFRHAELREALSRWTPRRIEAAITSAE